MKLLVKKASSSAIILCLIYIGSFMRAYADTRLIKNLVLLDAWKYNFNASHWIEQGNIHNGLSMYGDVEIGIKSLSKELIGTDFIQTAYGSKAFTGANIASFSLVYDAEVYIVHSRKITLKPSWMKSFTKTSMTLENVNAEQFDIYGHKYHKGDVVHLGANGNTRQAMYIVLVKPIGALPNKPVPQGKVFDALKYGAVGDGKTINTKALQTAVDACATAGGGSVYLHNGAFLSGTIVLKDKVTLYVEAGSILRGSHDIKDYAEYRPTLSSYRSNEAYQLIYAEKSNHISIIGGGIIDGYSLGNGQPWSNQLNEDGRPRLIRMSECKNVIIDQVTLIRSANWTQYFEGCENIKETNVHIRCYTGQDNEDGMDISGCKNVEVANYNAITGDDGICIKAMSLKPTEDLYIHDIYMPYVNCHAIKIGTETHGFVKHIRVDHVSAASRYGTAIESVDGAVVEDVVYDHITMRNCGVPIFIRLGQRGRVFKGGPEVAPKSVMRNVVVRNFTNTGINYVDTRDGPGVGSVISGLPGQEIENLTFENCNFLYYGSLKDPMLVNREIPENPKAYPEFNLLGICPAYGIYTRHIRGLTLKNVDIKCRFLDARPGLIMDDVKNYTLDGVTAERYPITQPVALWHKQDGKLSGSFTPDKNQ